MTEERGNGVVPTRVGELLEEVKEWLEDHVAQMQMTGLHTNADSSSVSNGRSQGTPILAGLANFTEVLRDLLASRAKGTS